MWIKRPIKTYTPKALIDGAKIDQQPGTNWVAVPDKYAGKQLKVVYKGTIMTIRNWKTEAVMFRTFRDKYWTKDSGRSQFYTLGYFKFNPQEY